ncbi:ABC transporter ATP-binding protein [Nocardioides bizhenqiangii]|uniref:Spermidine/putrescine import ATP-binding protein PotA n=1 Tax=Nocardioides bizhenqiangii TaxID=3095076 RepID=A0ABZ0ZSJ9_9ACTN|nr:MULTISPECIES: ABC transporter ATP-binding protein [unclassified Nocardioides]MDZ5622025.1 ABC transporter ATP-binding protein [Nocardioides sp. HM23]WQQ27298.1 ABC transporter ATP-binding protein [Nocardioides sp. HM61]
MTATPTPAAALLEVVDVNRRFGDVAALDDVSLTIAENEFFALLGPSGCGKTTLLRSIAGFEQPDSGAILLGGDDLLGLPPNRRPVNLMFQSYALFPHMTVERNVAYGLQREGLGRAEVRARVDEVLETVGLTALTKRRPRNLSGGQKQRVALARAIVKRPRLLLLDEPLSALDRKVRMEMQLELKRLQHEVGITFVLVTHDQEEALSMADRVAVMADGRVQQVATPVDLYRRPANLFVADFIGSSNRFAGRVDGGVFVSELLGKLPGATDAQQMERAHLVVRPEDIRIFSSTDGGGTLQGRVIDVQFKGGSSHVAVDVAGALTPLLVSVAGTADVDRGDDVALDWSAAVVVSEELA